MHLLIPRPRTREELLLRLVDILESGRESHTDAVNGLESLLYDEAGADPDTEWATKYRALPEPR
jgi:hypothetical protein